MFFNQADNTWGDGDPVEAQQQQLKQKASESQTTTPVEKGNQPSLKIWTPSELERLGIPYREYLENREAYTQRLQAIEAQDRELRQQQLQLFNSTPILTANEIKQLDYEDLKRCSPEGKVMAAVKLRMKEAKVRSMKEFVKDA